MSVCIYILRNIGINIITCKFLKIYLLDEFYYSLTYLSNCIVTIISAKNKS